MKEKKMGTRVNKRKFLSGEVISDKMNKTRVVQVRWATRHPKYNKIVKKAAKFLGVSPGTLRDWDRCNKLKVRRNPMNKYRLYRREDLERVADQVLWVTSEQGKVDVRPVEVENRRWC